LDHPLRPNGFTGHHPDPSGGATQMFHFVVREDGGSVGTIVVEA
jgi:hypothetical protein